MQTDIAEMERAAWPWTTAFTRRLQELRPEPFHGTQVLFGSDYSGSHSGSRFRTYGFVVADADASPEWPSRCRKVRDDFLANGRRMSFKNMNDAHRQRALMPFLEAAESLEGHVVVVAVDKEITYLSTHRGTKEIWNGLHGVHAKWDPKAFEQMVRVAHFFSLFLAAWSSPGMHVSWITDNDDIVANDSRLEDAHQFAARLSSLYLPHPLGEFMMNTPTCSAHELGFEDFIAIPDLAAGMISEVLAHRPSHEGIRRPGANGVTELTRKSDIIADWFWHNDGSLKKTCIIMNRAAGGKLSMGQLRTEFE